MLLQGVCALLVKEQVGLVAADDHRTGGQFRRILLQLGADGLKILHRIPPFAARGIHQMHQQTAPVDVPQKVVTQASSFAGALDDAGDVCHDEADPFIHIDHAQVGHEGGEVIVGDLRMSLADHAQQGALAYVGEAHQPHIGQQLQLQHHLPTLARQASLGETRRLTGGGGEMLVAPAASAAPCQHIARAAGHILNDLLSLSVSDDRAIWHPDDEILAVLAGAACARAVRAIFGHIFAFVTEIHQGG